MASIAHIPIRVRLPWASFRGRTFSPRLRKSFRCQPTRERRRLLNSLRLRIFGRPLHWNQYWDKRLPF